VTFLAVLFGGITNVLANMNPLLPLDGYFALSDYLEIPESAAAGLRLLGRVGRRRVLGAEVREPRRRLGSAGCSASTGDSRSRTAPRWSSW
jgi:hypothetical protein